MPGLGRRLSGGLLFIRCRQVQVPRITLWQRMAAIETSLHNKFPEPTLKDKTGIAVSCSHTLTNPTKDGLSSQDVLRLQSAKFPEWTWLKRDTGSRPPQFSTASTQSFEARLSNCRFSPAEGVSCRPRPWVEQRMRSCQRRPLCHR